MADGGEVCTVYKNKISVLPVWCEGTSYIERKNLLAESGGRMESYFDSFYHIDKGKFVKTAGGEYGLFDESYYEQEDSDVENIEKYFIYKWNDKEVSKAQYNQYLKKTFDRSAAIVPYNNTFSASYMISMLKNDFYDFYPADYDSSEDDIIY